MVNQFKYSKMTRRNKILIVLALLIVAIPSWLIYDYTQNNPKFCTTCHLMNTAYETWDQSAMQNLNCHECHESDIVESLGHVVEVLTENPQHVTKITEIDNELCEHCHASNDPQWLQVINTAGHKAHVFGREQPPDCIDCHGLCLHVFEASEEICIECHEESIMMSIRETEISCMACHEFTTRLFFPEREDCINCHDFARQQAIMEEFYHKNIQVDTNCLSCHNPHMEKQYIECEDCHDTSGYGLHNGISHNDCEVCHSPHTLVEMRDNCLTCHTDRIEHYAPAECYNCHSFDS